ncbi:MAG: replication initiator protein A [Lachnospiraceae bacterium]|nr:replication initiator protein A [Lachnospiraceae bacterium]
MTSPDRYYHGSDLLKLEQLTFPILLLESDKYESLSNDARVLYGVLFRRMKLSLYNQWMDENNRAYFYFTREEMAKAIRVSVSTIKRVVKQLLENDLLEEKRQGLNKPNKLYLLQPYIPLMEECFSDDGDGREEDIPYINPMKDDTHGINQRKARPGVKSDKKNRDIQNGQNKLSGESNLTLPEGSGRAAREYNTRNDNICFIPPSPPTDDREQLTQEMKEKTGYDSFSDTDLKLADSILSIVVDVLMFYGKTFRISQNYHDVAEVKEIFRKLRHCDIDHAINAVKTNAEISNYRNYVITVLYNHAMTPDVDITRQYRPRNTFFDFEQREYDDDLMRQIMEAQGQ